MVMDRGKEEVEREKLRLDKRRIKTIRKNQQQEETKGNDREDKKMEERVGKMGV